MGRGRRRRGARARSSQPSQEQDEEDMDMDSDQEDQDASPPPPQPSGSRSRQAGLPHEQEVDMSDPVIAGNITALSWPHKCTVINLLIYHKGCVLLWII